MQASYHRRAVLAIMASACLPGKAGAEASLLADDGSPVRHVAVDQGEAQALARLAQPVGPEAADTILVELFDYNCGYCRNAAKPLDAIVARIPRLALRLLHNPVLSPTSLEAAIVQRAVFRRHGPARAAALHQAMLATRGRMDGEGARAISAALQLGDFDADAMESARSDVMAMRGAAGRFGFRIVPTFLVGSGAFMGWPGPATLESVVAAARQCGRLTCA